MSKYERFFRKIRNDLNIRRKEAFKEWNSGNGISDENLQLVHDDVQNVLDVLHAMGESGVFTTGLRLKLDTVRASLVAREHDREYAERNVL